MSSFLFIKSEQFFSKLNFSDVLYIEAEKKHVQFVTPTKSFVVPASITEIEKLLPNDLFCRIHRSYIISLEHTSKFNCDFAYVGNKKIPMSKHYRTSLKNSVIALVGEVRLFKLDNGDVDKLLNDLGA